jgi:hypothetical protein
MQRAFLWIYLQINQTLPQSNNQMKSLFGRGQNAPERLSLNRL